MAQKKKKPSNTVTQFQQYPRIQDENNEFNGFLDDSKLVQHKYTIPEDEFERLILSAIEKANARSAREMISIDDGMNDEEIAKLYKDRAWDLFKYFQTYPGDPASTAHQLHNRQCRQMAEELFRNKTLQMERMNSGWRYQYLVVDSATKTGRFEQVSDRGAKEADFVAVISYEDAKTETDKVNLYVSVKNRANTIGGPDWPKSIADLEAYAANDRNRLGPYCCVFGIAMGSGLRQIKRRGKKSKEVYSWNTELWLSDYFWPFFTNFSYATVMLHVLDVLMGAGYEPDELPTEVKLPEQFLDAFEDYCHKFELVDGRGIFTDPYKLVQFFCGPKVRKPSEPKTKNSKKG